MKNPVRVTDINNQVDIRTVYPEGAGPTLAGRASALTPYTAGGYKEVPTLTVQELMGGYARGG